MPGALRSSGITLTEAYFTSNAQICCQSWFQLHSAHADVVYFWNTRLCLYADALIYADLLICWYADMLNCWYADMPICIADMLICVKKLRGSPACGKAHHKQFLWQGHLCFSESICSMITRSLVTFYSNRCGAYGLMLEPIISLRCSNQVLQCKTARHGQSTPLKAQWIATRYCAI